MTPDPALSSAAMAALNKAIEVALRYDPGTQATLRALAGKVLLVNCTSPSLSLYAVIEEDGVRLASHHEQPVHCTLSGSAPALASLLWQDQHSLADTGVTVSGEPSLLGNVQQLAKQLDLDWQQALADALGETAAFPLTRLMNMQSQWLRQRSERLPEWLADVLTEELQLLPARTELEQFYDEVNQLRAESERLQARIDKLSAARCANHQADL